MLVWSQAELAKFKYTDKLLLNVIASAQLIYDLMLGINFFLQATELFIPSESTLILKEASPHAPVLESPA